MVDPQQGSTRKPQHSGQGQQRSEAQTTRKNTNVTQYQKNRSRKQQSRSRPGGQQGNRGDQLTGPNGKLRIIPLGGVAEIGKNMTVVQYEDDIVVIDSGTKFPEEDLGGIDLMVPNAAWLKPRLDQVRAFVYSHGHEDHIGGLPFVLKQLSPKKPIRVIAPPLALGLIEAKLVEYRLEKLVTLETMEKGPIQLGKLSLDYARVTHSIPDSNAVIIRSPVGTIVDTGDFKFDQTPVMGKATDEAKLRRVGDEGVLVLLSDTTRVETPGSTPSEQLVLETIDKAVAEAKGQVILTTFASNISRLEMALRAAKKHGRKVAVAGRSMQQSSRVAKDLGYLSPDEGLLIDLDQALKLPREKRLLCVTGSQGEPEAALGRIALADHPKIKIGQGDVVIISATPVPGNEVTVSNTIDNLFRRGATVIYSPLDRGVHVSGHAARDELKRMLKLVRPKYIVPVHGEYRHFVLYRDLVESTGMPRESVLIPEGGSIIEFTANSAAFNGSVEFGSVMVDRLFDRGPASYVLRGEQELAKDGLVIISAAMKRSNGELLAGPTLVTMGLPPEVDARMLNELENELRKFLSKHADEELEYGYVVRRSKEIVGRAISRKTSVRPLIVPALTVL